MADTIIVITPNPVGLPQDVKEVKDFIQEMLLVWKDHKTAVKESKFRKAVGFILGGLDALIQIVDDLIDVGPDKKATVIAAVVVLYDNIVGPALPMWLKPFAKPIRAFIIDVVISLAIDFIVRKYREGTWKPAQESTPEVSPESASTPAPATIPESAPGPVSNIKVR